MSTAPISTLVVDDERLARTGLRALLAGDVELVVEECARGADAARVIRAHAIDLVFLDVRMPKVSGFDVIADLTPEHMPVVVLTTAYGEHALRAFDARVFDYLVKPIVEDRLAQAVARAKAEIRTRRLAALAAESTAARERRLLVRSGVATYYLNVDDIDWIQAEACYARLWTGARSHLVRQTLDSWEATLDGQRFVRVHRGAIVNVGRIAEIRRFGVGRHCVVLTTGVRISLSRDRKASLHAALRHATDVRCT